MGNRRIGFESARGTRHVQKPEGTHWREGGFVSLEDGSFGVCFWWNSGTMCDTDAVWTEFGLGQPQGLKQAIGERWNAQTLPFVWTS